MRKLLASLVLLVVASVASADTFSWDDTVVPDPFVKTNRATMSFTNELISLACSTNSIVVIGVNREAPEGQWLTATTAPTSFFQDGEVVVARPNAARNGLEVVARLGRVTPQDVQNAVAPPAPVQYSTPVMYYNGAGGCSNGSCGVGYGYSVGNGLRMVMGFGGLRGGGGRCGIGGCN